jgi:hypothetical protein
MSGDAWNVVQTGSVENVVVGASHDRRGVIALAVVAVVLAVAVVLVVFAVNDDDQADSGQTDSGPPVAAVSSFMPVGCRTGWVVPDRGDERIPYTTRPLAGVLSSGGEVTVTVQGLTGRSVVLQSMTVEVVRRSPPMAGVYLPEGCQGEVTPRQFVLDLDAAAPRIVTEPGSVSFPYKVNDIEPEQFVITPEVTAGDVEWRLRLRWTSGGETGELMVDDAGKPFRTTATAGARKFCFAFENMAWQPSC